jgi:hypothetical protein
MKNKFILILALFCSMQMVATNLILLKSDGSQLLQDIALIGKWVYVGDDLQLLSHDGVVLAQEPIMSIRKIMFAESSITTSTENIPATQIFIYPNPTQDLLLINGAEAQDLRVFDLQGRLLKTENGTQMNVSDLAGGTYLLQVGTQVLRFIKK